MYYTKLRDTKINNIMLRFPELEFQPNGAEIFYNEYKDKLSEEKLLKGFSFAQACDEFQRQFNKYLLSDKSSMYPMNQAIKQYYEDHQNDRQNLLLYSVFIREHLSITRDMLLEKEYYELMKKFDETMDKLRKLLNMLLADHVEQQS